MKPVHSISILLSALCLITLHTIAQNSAGKIILTKGQKFEINNNTKSVISQEMMGQAIEITVDANMVHKVEVIDKMSNSYLIASTLTKLTTNGSAMGQEMKFDSDKKEDMESETGKLMKDQLNITKEIEISEMAKVIKSSTKSATSAPSGQLMDMLNNITGGYIDESNGASSAFEIIPAGKKIGDFWSDSTIMGDIKTYNSYTLKSITNNIATLELKGKQLINKKMEQQGMEINIKMEAKISGEGIVDMNTGLLQQKTTLTDGNGAAEVMGQSIPMSSKITTITTIKKV